MPRGRTTLSDDKGMRLSASVPVASVGTTQGIRGGLGEAGRCRLVSLRVVSTCPPGA